MRWNGMFCTPLSYALPKMLVMLCEAIVPPPAARASLPYVVTLPFETESVSFTTRSLNVFIRHSIAKAAREGGFCSSRDNRLGKMRRNELRHLEHVDHILAAEDLLEVRIRLDIALVRG